MWNVNNDYQMSEKLFLDVWEEFGKPDEIYGNETAYKFLSKIILKSKGLVIFDQFNYSNYDHIHSISVDGDYIKIYWKNYESYRNKLLNNALTEEEILLWSVFGYTTYDYTMLNLNKIKFLKVKNHLFILFQSIATSRRKAKKDLKKIKGELLNESHDDDAFCSEYVFLEGPKEDLKKHICKMNRLPYYTCLIQPKENSFSGGASRDLMLIETLREILKRLTKVQNELILTDEYDFDRLSSHGSTVRKILEYVLKFYCLYKNIELKGKVIDDQYGHVSLGELDKAIADGENGINLSPSVVRIANELSHDSGTSFTKQDVIVFWNSSLQIVRQIQKVVMKDLK